MADSIERLTEAHALFVALDDAAGAASCLKNLGNRYLDQGDTGLARAAYEAALEAYEAVGNRLGRGMVFDCLGLVAAREGDHAEATRLHGLSSALYREQGDLALLAPSLTFLARARLASGDVPAASSLLDESIALQLKLGNRRHLADAVRTRGDVAVIMGDQRAASHYRRSLTLSREEGDAWGAVQALIGLGGCHLDVGELAEAERVWREALPLARDMRLGSEVALVLEGLAQVALGRGDETYAARLAATAAGARAAVGGDESAVGRLRRERFTALLGKLGRGAQTTGAAAPQPLDLDELVVALKETNPFSASARPLRPAGRRQRS